MTKPVLLQFYQELPETKEGSTRDWARQFQVALDKFKRAVLGRYAEATLQRLLISAAAEARQAAVLALGLVGTMRVNDSLAARLHDEDYTVRQLAGDAMWSLWFRAASPEHGQELQKLMRLSLDKLGAEPILAGFEALLEKAPKFAEVYNQRAILYFRIGELNKAIADCTKVLRSNPYHFGAASGMGQCYMKQKKLHAALRAYRRAFRINPNLDDVQQVIQSLERMLGEERK